MNNIKFSNSYDGLPMDVKKALQAEGNVFFDPSYLKYIQLSGGELLYFYDENNIVPLSINKGKGFKQGRFITQILSFNEGTFSMRETFINAVVDLIRVKKIVDWIDVTPASASFDVCPVRSKRIPWGNLVIDLSLEEDEILSKMSSTHRNEVRRAQKEGCFVKIGSIDLLNEYLTLDQATWKRSNKQVDHSKVYSDILNTLGEKAFIAISYNKDGVPQSGMLSYYNSICMYYMFGASLDKPSRGSVKYLHWEVIKEMKKRGVKSYSFVGYRINVDKDSKLAGIQRFKEGFGGDLVKSVMFKCEVNTFKHNLYKTLIWLKSGKIIKDAVDEEISKWDKSLDSPIE